MQRPEEWADSEVLASSGSAKREGCGSGTDRRGAATSTGLWAAQQCGPWRAGCTRGDKPSPGSLVCMCARSVVSDSCDPMDGSPPGFSVRGISQARILERVAISSSRASS